jgi:hypothetical protein
VAPCNHDGANVVGNDADGVDLAEPATAYSLRTPLVVDASVIAAAVFDEERREAAEGWMFGRACAHLR